MQSKDYFKKTFVFVFMFYIVFKATEQMMTDFSKFNFVFMFKTFIIGVIVALVLGGMNYFAKVDFPSKLKERKSKDNSN